MDARAEEERRQEQRARMRQRYDAELKAAEERRAAKLAATRRTRLHSFGLAGGRR